jgi:hypothetical protein
VAIFIGIGTTGIIVYIVEREFAMLAYGKIAFARGPERIE